MAKSKVRTPRERHVFGVRFHDTTKCHVIAPNAQAAIKTAVRWRNAINHIDDMEGKKRAVPALYSNADIRAVEHLARIDTIPKG